MKNLIALTLVSLALAFGSAQRASAGVVVGASIGVAPVVGYCAPAYSCYPRPAYGYYGSSYGYNYYPPPAVVYTPPPAVIYRPPVVVAPPVIGFRFGFGDFHHHFYHRGRW